MKKLLMGNEAIALGALAAGVGLVAGYPGTPSTETLEAIAKYKSEEVYVEWSVNEKAALEVAAGASYAGMRTLVTMKQVGLNVASDPLMSLAYVGVKGGMVVMVADDPGPISSQTEQDTRTFARFSKLPVFDPDSPEQAYEMVIDAFELSERLGTPVLLRPTTRVCHGCAAIEVRADRKAVKVEGFIKDSRWVIFPRLSYQSHLKIEARNAALTDELSDYRFNTVTGEGRQGIAVGGVSSAYLAEAAARLDVSPRTLRIGTPHPFPERLAVAFLQSVDEVLVIEELDPVIERELIYLCGKHHLPTVIRGKLTGELPHAGERTTEQIEQTLNDYLKLNRPVIKPETPPTLPIRPPVLCAGCPHRASFYAVKQAMKGRKAVFCGDIGCYTLGNAQPLDMVDTCLCMGADLTIAQGLQRAEPDAVHFSFIGDSTFFASGMTGIVNAVYNETKIVLIVLDNSTTAMTGHQPHPGTGKTMMGSISEKVRIDRVLEAVGVGLIRKGNPFDLAAAKRLITEAADYDGVSAVIFEAPCIAVTSPAPLHTVDAAGCVGCRRCITELGCPAISMADGKAVIEPSLCYGCNICAQVCPTGAIAPIQKEVQG